MKHFIYRIFLLVFPVLSFADTLPDVSPDAQGQYVAINIPQQRLFLYKNGKLVKIYPVAVGKAMTQTNLGEHKIGGKTFNPVWHIPKSIQKERADGVTTVAAGPNNPLGPVFVRLGDPKLGLGIHGTNAPASVPGVRSHGCVRMKSPDALEFAKTIASGTTASVIYQMAGLNEDASGNLWLAVFRDPYKKNNLNTQLLRQSIDRWATAHHKNIDTKRIDAILKARTGLPICLSCTQKTKMKTPLKSLAWTSGSSDYSRSRPAAAAVLQSQTTKVDNLLQPSAPAAVQPQQSVAPAQPDNVDATQLLF